MQLSQAEIEKRLKDLMRRQGQSQQGRATGMRRRPSFDFGNVDPGSLGLKKPAPAPEVPEWEPPEIVEEEPVETLPPHMLGGPDDADPGDADAPAADDLDPGYDPTHAPPSLMDVGKLGLGFLSATQAPGILGPLLALKAFTQFGLSQQDDEGVGTSPSTSTAGSEVGDVSPGPSGSSTDTGPSPGDLSPGPSGSSTDTGPYGGGYDPATDPSSSSESPGPVGSSTDTGAQFGGEDADGDAK